MKIETLKTEKKEQPIYNSFAAFSDEHGIIGVVFNGQQTIDGKTKDVRLEISIKEWEQNIKLAQTNSELLEALELITARINDNWENIILGKLNGTKSALLHEANQAILKAKGEQNNESN